MVARECVSARFQRSSSAQRPNLRREKRFGVCDAPGHLISRIKYEPHHGQTPGCIPQNRAEQSGNKPVPRQQPVRAVQQIGRENRIVEFSLADPDRPLYLRLIRDRRIDHIAE